MEGLGLDIEGSKLRIQSDATSHVADRIDKIKTATKTLREEDLRRAEIDAQRDVERVRAQTAARQRGMSIAETEKQGNQAAEALSLIHI